MDLIYRVDMVLIVTSDQKGLASRFISGFQSVVARGLLAEVAEKSKFLPLFMNFSAQTTSKRVQENIEGKLEKRGKTRLGMSRILLFLVFTVNSDICFSWNNIALKQN